MRTILGSSVSSDSLDIFVNLPSNIVDNKICPLINYNDVMKFIAQRRAAGGPCKQHVPILREPMDLHSQEMNEASINVAHGASDIGIKIRRIHIGVRRANK
jgi:hypothetical protein